MPAADIKEISVTWHDERRGEQEYNPPMKKAEVHLYATVPEGGDGTVALAYITSVAQAKVKEMLSGVVAGPLATSGEQALADQAAAAPKTRTRSKPAEAPKDPAPAEGSESASQTGATIDPAASAEGQVGETAAPATTGGEGDEWGVETAAPEITEEALLKATSAAASEGRKREDILALIATFNTKGAGQQFSAKEIPAALRADYLAKLKAIPLAVAGV